MTNLKFEVEDFSVVKQIEDEQFAIVELYVCNAGDNAHNMPIKLSTLKKAANTLKNKYLVAGFDGSDFEGHEPNERIVGHFPESGKISYKKKDGKTFLVAEAVMSKVYANWAYEQFVNKNHRGVSMEITVTKLGEEKDGLTEIKEFVFNGVTILGDTHTPACEGADASIIKFSVENALEFYGKYSWKSNSIVRDFVDSMRNETGKEETETMKDTEQTTAEEIVVEETNEVVEEVVEEPVNTEPVAEENPETEEVFTEEEPTEPKAEDDNETTMEQDDTENDDNDEPDDDNDTEDKDDDEGDTDDNGESKDENFESLTVEQKYQVFQAACNDNKLGWLESFDDEYVYCHDCSDGYTYRYSYSLNGTECTIKAEDKVRVMRGGYVPFEANAEETEAANAENVTNPEVETLQEENAKLKDTIAGYEAEKKSFEVESILSNVIDSLTPEQIDDLRQDSENYSLDNLTEFSNKVKALAFESVKGSKGKYDFAKVAFGDTSAETTHTGKYSW